MSDPQSDLVFLTGFMGTGKSTIGRRLAERRSATFVDLDARLTAEFGKPIAQIFAELGESTFRSREKATLLRLIEESRGPVVFSLGGGALLDRELRLHVLDVGTVLCLTASPDEILRRTRGDASMRPLLAAPDPKARILELLAARAPAYAECHATLKTDGKSPSELAQLAAEALDRKTIAVASGLDSYQVEVGASLIGERLGAQVKGATGILLVTDENVGPLYEGVTRRALEGHGPSVKTIRLTPGEEYKTVQSMEAIWNAAYEAELDRKGLFVGLGGGVVTDMTGFAAATWVRGVRWVGIPTTLLSMVDASVGGKTAVDFGHAKNAVGAFWQPSSVLCDVTALRTERERAYIGALSEVVKTALIGDPDLLTLLEDRAELVKARDEATLTEVVRRSVRVKARVVGLDPRESGLRATLNLGHTLGHAMESAGGYSRFTHGEAVSLGLVAALRLGVLLGRTPPALRDRVVALLARLGLPHKFDKDLLEASVPLLGRDKKRAGTKINFIFAHGPGDVRIEPIELAELKASSPKLADPAHS